MPVSITNRLQFRFDTMGIYKTPFWLFFGYFLSLNVKALSTAKPDGDVPGVSIDTLPYCLDMVNQNP